MKKKKVLFWFRSDLRLSDNPGLSAAAKQGQVLPIYIFSSSVPQKYRLGSTSRWWLSHSLELLDRSLDGHLQLYAGDPKELIIDIVQRNNLDAVFMNRCYEPWHIQDDYRIEKKLLKLGISVHAFSASLLWNPDEIATKSGTPYKMFTPFYKNGCLQADAPRKPVSKPRSLSCIRDVRKKDTISIKEIRPDSSQRFMQLKKEWSIGEDAAKKRLQAFIRNDLVGYKKHRDYPARAGTSRLSPYLHFGEISPNQVWYAVKKGMSDRAIKSDAEHFLRELGWREFSYYLLYHFSDLPEKNFKSEFDRFPWRMNTLVLKAWQQGKTGYPIIDAGMRQLLQTGYMHNRVRMIVASFLVKNCLLHWHHGRDWFWEQLCDADLANNSASWQWVAGSGADAAPYFRIFNPVTQGKKFDPDGTYIRMFVPEVRALPDKYLFEPWKAPVAVLRESGVVLGDGYPHPIVDLKKTRERALQAYYRMKDL